MHALTIPQGISEPVPVYGGQPMEAGKTYVCTNAFAGAMLLTPWRVMIGDEMWALRSLLSANEYHPAMFYDKDVEDGVDLGGIHLWLMRAGGWGDLLMLTPSIRFLKKRHPELTIHVAIGESHKGIFDGLGVIEESIPIEKSRLEAAFFVSFEDHIEGHPAAEKVHIAQHFADKLGIDLDGDYQPSYTILDVEADWQAITFPKTDKKRVGVQYMASSLYRSYPQIEKVIKLLLEYDMEVFIFGAVGQIAMNGETPPSLTNLTDPAFNCTFRRSAAVVKSCDCIIAPDSALVHLASALEVPYVGLYGPMPPNLRGSGKHGKGIQGMAECSPCFFHATKADDFPANMPCSKAGYCVALAQITPEEIVEAALRLTSPIIQLPKQNQGRIIIP